MEKYYLNDIYWVLNKTEPVKVVPIIFNKKGTSYQEILTGESFDCPNGKNTAKKFYYCNQMLSTNTLFKSSLCGKEKYYIPLTLKYKLTMVTDPLVIEAVIAEYTDRKQVSKSEIKKMRDKIYKNFCSSLDAQTKKKLKENQKKAKRETNRNSYINF